ncbi:MAG: hypothetical protein R2932_24805 [Caldilineaceae bacterium]
MTTVAVPVDTSGFDSPLSPEAPSAPTGLASALSTWDPAAMLASGQMSLVLVGALFVGIFTVIGLVLGRKR